MRGYQRIAERQIEEALEDGKLNGLPGEGKPLPLHITQPFLDPVEAAGYHMMAKSGALPEELRLRKALSTARAAFAASCDEDEKHRLMAEIADLELRHHLIREKRTRTLR